eukprot:9477269-Pyramimonas_sp.AAC.2
MQTPLPRDRLREPGPRIRHRWPHHHRPWPQSWKPRHPPGRLRGRARVRQLQVRLPHRRALPDPPRHGRQAGGLRDGAHPSRVSHGVPQQAG